MSVRSKISDNGPDRSTSDILADFIFNLSISLKKFILEEKTICQKGLKVDEVSSPDITLEMLTSFVKLAIIA